jgi:hypothetical protein
MATKRNSENKVSMPSGAAAVPARRKSSATRASRPPVVEASVTPEVAFVESATEVTTEVTNDVVARLAYSYWEARGYQGGSPEEDWLRAEQELRASIALIASK